MSRMHARAGQIQLGGQQVFLTEWAIMIALGGVITLETTPEVRPESGLPEMFQLLTGSLPGAGYFTGTLWPDGSVTGLVRTFVDAGNVGPEGARLLIRRLTDGELTSR